MPRHRRQRRRTIAGRPGDEAVGAGSEQHEADRHPDRRRRHAGAQRDRPRRRGARQPAARRGLRLHQGLLGACSTRASPTSTSTRSSPRSPSSTRRAAAPSSAPRARSSTRTTRETIAQIADRLKQLKIDGLICVGGDGTLNGLQPFAELLPRRPRPQDDRQRPRPQPPQRARRVGARARAPEPPGYTLPARPLAHPLRARRHGQLRHARLRDRRLRLRPGRAARAHHGREPPPHRDRRGDGPPLRLHRPRHRLRPARHHPRARGPGARSPPSSSACASSTSCRRTWSSSAARASSTRTAASSARSARSHDPAGNVVALRAPRTRCATCSIDHFGDLYFQQYRRAESAQGRGLHPKGRAHPARRPADPVRPLPRGPARRQGGRHAARGPEQRDRDPAVEPRAGLLRGQLRRQRASATAGASSTPATCTRASTTRS